MPKWAPQPSERSRQRPGPQYYNALTSGLACSYLIHAPFAESSSFLRQRPRIAVRHAVLCPWILPSVVLLLSLHRLAVVRSIVCSFFVAKASITRLSIYRRSWGPYHLTL